MKSTIIERPKQQIEDDDDEIEKAIFEYNHTQPGFVEPRSFKYRLHDDERNLIGGVDFSIINEWVFIEELAVTESQRRKGYGKLMLQEVEEHAKLQGCTMADLASSNYQAPEFYKKCGYELKFVRETADPRNNVNIFAKKLK